MPSRKRVATHLAMQLQSWDGRAGQLERYSSPSDGCGVGSVESSGVELSSSPEQSPSLLFGCYQPNGRTHTVWGLSDF